MLRNANMALQCSDVKFDNYLVFFRADFFSNFLETTMTLLKNDEYAMKIIISTIEDELSKVAMHSKPILIREANTSVYLVDITELVKMKSQIIYDLSLESLIALTPSIESSVFQLIHIDQFSKLWARKAIQKLFKQCEGYRDRDQDTLVLCKKSEDHIMEIINISILSSALVKHLRRLRKFHQSSKTNK